MLRPKSLYQYILFQILFFTLIIYSESTTVTIQTNGFFYAAYATEGNVTYCGGYYPPCSNDFMGSQVRWESNQVGFGFLESKRNLNLEIGEKTFTFANLTVYGDISSLNNLSLNITQIFQFDTSIPVSFPLQLNYNLTLNLFSLLLKDSLPHKKFTYGNVVYQVRDIGFLSDNSPLIKSILQLDENFLQRDTNQVTFATNIDISCNQSCGLGSTWLQAADKCACDCSGVLCTKDFLLNENCNCECPTICTNPSTKLDLESCSCVCNSNTTCSVNSEFDAGLCECKCIGFWDKDEKTGSCTFCTLGEHSCLAFINGKFDPDHCDCVCADDSEDCELQPDPTWDGSNDNSNNNSNSKIILISIVVVIAAIALAFVFGIGIYLILNRVAGKYFVRLEEDQDGLELSDN